MNEQRELRYSVRVFWSAEDEGFVALSPEFQGVSAFGATYVEAVSELEQALALAVETHEEECWALPEPALEPQHSGQFRLRLPRSLHSWLAERAHREGVSLNTLVVSLLSRCRGGAEAADEAVERLEASVRRLERLAADPGAVLVTEPGGIAR